MKLKPEIKARWLEALRGNEYMQGKQSLRQGCHDPAKAEEWAYCCLGVLCDLSTVDGVGRWDGEIFVTETPGSVAVDRESGVLPAAVSRWAFDDDGISPYPTDPHVDTNRGCFTLSYHNDNGMSFAEIADAIEEAF